MKLDATVKITASQVARLGNWLPAMVVLLGAFSSPVALAGSFEERCARVATPEKPVPCIYDLKERLIEPLPFGPELKERIWTGLPRTQEELKETFGTVRDLLKRCYRWALLQRPGLRASLRIELEMDYFGVLSALAVEADTAEGSDLAGCAREVLQGLQDVQPLYTRRLTRAGVTVNFRPADTAVGSGEPPERPSATPLPESYTLCMRLPEKPPVDRIRLGDPVWSIDDRPPKDRGGRSFTCSGLDFGLWPLMLALDYNLGTFRKCHSDALKRRPGLAGRVVFTVDADLGGGVTGVEVSESDLDDETVVTCLRDSLERVWSWPMGTVCTNLRRSFPRMRVPFRLKPAKAMEVPPQPTPRPDGILPIAELEAWAGERLSRGDGRRAVQAYALLLQHRPEHPAACRWHAAALRAAVSRAPWIDQRVFDALDRLARYLRSHPDDDPQVCVGSLKETFWAIVEEPLGYTHRLWRHGFFQVSADRLRRILAVGDVLPADPNFRWYLACCLFRLGRYREALVEYERVSRDHPDAEKRKEARDSAEECRREAASSETPEESGWKAGDGIMKKRRPS